MAKSLVVVESPTKVKTLSKYLGRDFIIKASVGHVMDLPKSKLGVEIGDTFEPVYEVIKGKQKVLKEIQDAADKVDHVYLAPDPDREGEAIAWHIAGELRGKKKKSKISAKIYRVLIEEITKSGVERALASPRELNKERYESQQARRILDRLVGYKISPLLWEKVRRGLSAGRVQSVAVRIVVEREREIQKFLVEEYWSLDASVRAKNPPPFRIHVIEKDGEKLKITNQAEAEGFADDFKRQEIVVTRVTKKERKRTPPPAFTTSKLQQEASRKLGFTAKKTMMLAQQLYEGVELGEEGAVGLITYMRTDSTRLSNEAVDSVRQHISESFGEKYLPEKPRFYRTSKRAQDAHEAIRPTLATFTPEKVKKYLKKDAFRLYELIWNRFVACQMTEALFDQTAIDAKAGPYGLRATGSIMRFDGYIRVYLEGREEDEKSQDEEEAKEGELPDVEEGERLELVELFRDQHFTKPPARFTEASLVKELEELGIGRPSTYASILSTIQDRKYAEKKEGHFVPTELGILVCDLLVEHFPDILNVDFTAQLENQLDLVEEGEEDWQNVLRNFYGPFAKDLAQAKKKMRDVKREETPTEHVCDKCSKPMVIKWGRNGHFLACSGYPDCRNTKEFRKTEDGKIEILVEQKSGEVCETCGAEMNVKTGRFGRFLACSRYPECKKTRSMSTGVKCPEASCGGQLLEKRSRRGRMFYGCSKYPNCKHATWNRPLPQACPQCQAPYLVEKITKREGQQKVCRREGCVYKEAFSAAG